MQATTTFRATLAIVAATLLTAGGVVASPAMALGQAADSPVRINEVESNGDAMGDWVEIVNTSDSATDVDVSDYTLVDDDPDHAPVKLSGLQKVDASKDLELESGEHLALYTDETDDGFGLGGDDSVTLADADGTKIDSTTWSAHPVTTWGRVPDTSGDFSTTGKATPDAANVADGDDGDDRRTRAWPYPGGKASAALPGIDLGEDSSGADFDADGNAYIVNNGTGRLFKLAYDDGAAHYAIADVWDLNYPNGTGTPDAEGVTVTGDGTVYVGTERNNDKDGTSRPSVLKFAVPDAGGTADDPQALDATTEWNLKPDVGQVGANAGIEAIEWLPDVMGGVFAVGVEGTADVLFEKLGADGTFDLKQRWKSPTKGVMALDYQPGSGELLALADEADAGYSVSLTFDGTNVKTPVDDSGNTVLNRAPEGMADYADEGFARYVSSEKCTDGGGSATTNRYLWADDANTDGVGLRQATARGGTCASGGPSEPATPSGSGPSDSSEPGGTGDPRESSAPGETATTGETPTDGATASPSESISDAVPSAPGGGSGGGSGDEGAGGEPDAGGDLPRTGMNVTLAAGAGLLLIVAGVATMVVGRRRR